MIYTALIAALFLIACPFVFGSDKDDPNLNLDIVRRAIREVENWNGRSVGASGELGPYQIRPAVWLRHSERPLSWAYGKLDVHKAEQDRVAAEVIDWIDVRLPGLQLPRTAKSIGLVWTAGYGNVQYKQFGRAKRNYAQRVQNLYDDFYKTEMKKAAPIPFFAR